MNEKDYNGNHEEVREKYLYTGPKFLADQKLRFGKWLEEIRRE